MSGPVPLTRIAFERIVFATDFSACSERALRHAVAIARAYHGTFYLAHVVASAGFMLAGANVLAEATELARKDARQLLDRLVESGALTGIPHAVIVRQGAVWEELERVAEQYRADLFVLGTHGRTGLRKIVLGSVAEDIFRHSSCPVLTVGPCAPPDPPAAPGPLRILYPTDLSPESAQAAPYALSLAEEHHAELTLLHVVEHAGREAAGDWPRVDSALAARLHELAPARPGMAHKPLYRIEVGPVAECILGVAQQQSSHLIVLGLRSPQTYVDHLPWLHAYKIVCEAGCPVLTIRSAKPLSS